MNALNGELSVQLNMEEDTENLPHNLARYARASYSKKEIEEEEEALLDSKDETSKSSYSLDDSVSLETIDNIKDERLLKKIKEEQLIKKIRNENDLQKRETSSSVSNHRNINFENKNNESSSKDPVSTNYGNGVEEPEDEFVSYKTDTDQESTRTDSRASDTSYCNNHNYASHSSIVNNIIADMKSNSDGHNIDTIRDSVIVREHDDSSSSTCDDLENEMKSTVLASKKDEATKNKRSKKNTTTVKTKVKIMARSRSTSSGKANDMSPKVMIEDLNLTYEQLHEKIVLSPKSKMISNDASPMEKAKKQNTITSYFSSPTTKKLVKDKNINENPIDVSNLSRSDTPELKEDESIVHQDDVICSKTSNRRYRKKVMKKGNDSEDTPCCEDTGLNDSTESEISEAESEKTIEKTSGHMTTKRSSGVSMILSKRGRKIVKPNYNYDSSSEQTSDAEISRTASPSIGCETPSMELGGEEEIVENTLSKDNVLESGKLEIELPCKYVAGELAWARVGTAPFWPCTFTYDPDLKIHSYISKIQQTGPVRAQRQYHVQFFGRPQRAWVKEQGVLKFEGLDAFNESGLKLKRSSKGASKNKLINAYFPKGVQKQTWQAAVDEMLSTKDMSIDERLRFAKSLFDESVKQEEQRALEKKLNKRKRQESGNSVSSTMSSASSNQKTLSPPNKKRREKNVGCNRMDSDSKNESYDLTDMTLQRRKKGDQEDYDDDDTSGKNEVKFPDIDRLIKSIPPNKLIENRRKLKTGFKLFQLANKSEITSNIVLENVNFENISDLLNSDIARWNDLSPAERRFYSRESQKIAKKYSPRDSKQKNSTNSDSDTTVNDDKKSSHSSISVTNKRKNLIKTKHEEIRMVGVFKKKNCCVVCEDIISPIERSTQEKFGTLKSKDQHSIDDPIIKCRGGCNDSYHISCIGSWSIKTDNWKCKMCENGLQQCFICKTTNSLMVLEPIQKCRISDCGKSYHRSCLEKYNIWPQARFTEQTITCPAHICHTCASENIEDPYMKFDEKVLQCIRCPTSYHAGDYCVAAGSIQITSNQIICPKHFRVNKVMKKSSSQSHISTNWCSVCSNYYKGGELICCERCSMAFHQECLGEQLHADSLPDKFYCYHCTIGRLPLYGEVLWVKMGGFRWWPSIVVHPTKIPANIEKMNHDIGEFPVQFCGTNEYYWMNHGRCFYYEECDSVNKNVLTASSGSSTGLNAKFQKGLIEAAQLFNEFKKVRAAREEDSLEKMNKVGCSKNIKPPPYVKIKSNKSFGDCQVYTADPSEYITCECDPDGDEPCGENSGCINRVLFYECPITCSAGMKCLNQRFQRRSYPKLQVRRTVLRGWGLDLAEDVTKDSFIIEYSGEIITMAEFHSRIEHSRKRKEPPNYYYMTLDSNRMIDAGPKGNLSRFMNHSCNPNCYTQKWTVNGDTRVGLFAMNDILKGEELTFNYQFEVVGDVKQKCFCRAKNCSGFIGEKPNRLTPEIALKTKDVNCNEAKESNKIVKTNGRASRRKVKHIKEGNKIKVRKIPCSESNCDWEGRKEHLVNHLHNVHDYSKENSEKLSSLAFELAIRRRQEAASKARSLNLKIKISQVSKSPKKSIILEENLSNDASSTSGLTNNNTTTSITDEISEFEENQCSKTLNESSKSIDCLLCTLNMPNHQHDSYSDLQLHKDNIVKVGPAIDENTGKASLKAKPILDTKEDNGSQNNTLNVSTEEIKGSHTIDQNDDQPKRRQLNESVISTPSKDLSDHIGKNTPTLKKKNLNNENRRLSTRLSTRNQITSPPGHLLRHEGKTYVHSSNTARHWRSQHPQLQYSPRKFSHNQNRFQENDLNSNDMSQNSASRDIWSSQLHSSTANTENHVQQGEKDRRSSQRIKESFTLIKPNSSTQNHTTEDNMTQKYRNRSRSRR